MFSAHVSSLLINKTVDSLVVHTTKKQKCRLVKNIDPALDASRHGLALTGMCHRGFFSSKMNHLILPQQLLSFFAYMGTSLPIHDFDLSGHPEKRQEHHLGQAKCLFQLQGDQ